MTDDVRTYRIGGCEVVRGPSWVVTRFPDGTEVHAHPDTADPSQPPRATSLGYPDVEAMTRDHDALHTLVAVAALGLDRSPVLYGVATGDYAARHQVELEERLVLLLQRVAQVGIDAVLEDYAVATGEGT